MSDICMCDDASCTQKESCFRFKAKASEFQSYFTDSPKRLNYNGGYDCDMYWQFKGPTSINVLNKTWSD